MLDTEYINKDNHYYKETRLDIFNALKKHGTFDKVLEIGCGNGGLLKSLQEMNVAKEVYGVEPYGYIESENNVLTKFYKLGAVDALGKLDNDFDLIIFADVLEHLIDPWSILTEYAKKLNRDGLIIISIPNFRNFMTMYKVLIKNSFKYEKEGVFDKTHLRFFCKDDVVDLIKQADLEPIFITQNFKHKPSKFFSVNRLKYLNMFTLNLMPNFISDQLIFICKKNEK